MRQLLFFFFLMLVVPVFSQQDTSVVASGPKLVTIKGKVSDPDLISPFYSIMVINRRTRQGKFGKFDGTFNIKARQSDTILISTRGYEVVRLCFKDSIEAEEYEVNIKLSMIQYVGAVVEVKPLKTLKQLKEARAKLAKEKSRTPDPRGIDAFASPITALFNIFSKKEKSKKLLRELEYKASQKEILKEMMRVYVHNDIIQLEPHEFDDCIEFLNIDAYTLNTASDYQLIVYIKDKFQHYLQINDYYYERD